VLDIGPGAGAAIVVTPSSLRGEEIEIRAAGASWEGTHVAVRRRNGVGGVQYAAIFGSLAEGPYEFRVRAERTEEPVLALRVPDAAVAVGRWPATRLRR
jgi:hypothetical protein